MFSIKQIIARIVDDSRMHEFKLAYGVSIITGFCHIEGYAFKVFFCPCLYFDKYIFIKLFANNSKCLQVNVFQLCIWVCVTCTCLGICDLHGIEFYLIMLVKERWFSLHFRFLVGVVGNNGQMTSEAALKGSHFVQLCSQRSIPIVFFQNTTSNSSELLTIKQGK